MAQELVSDAVVAQSEAQARSFWHMRETHFGSAEARRRLDQARHLGAGGLDSGASSRKRPPLVVQKFPGARPVSFGHLGDGNMHFNFNAPPGKDAEFPRPLGRDAADRARHRAAIRGSISAEHGIGVMKRDILPRYKSSEELDAMRALKHALDPKNILNPGKTVPPVRRL